MLCDASVALKWFHSRGEQQAAEARLLVEAAADDRLQLRLIDLAYFEIGNVLTRRLRWAGRRVSEALRLLPEVTGEPLRLGLDDLARAAELADRHQLTFYDASYWAAALGFGAELATMDGALLAAGGGRTPAQLCRHLALG